MRASGHGHRISVQLGHSLVVGTLVEHLLADMHHFGPRSVVEISVSRARYRYAAGYATVFDIHLLVIDSLVWQLGFRARRYLQRMVAHIAIVLDLGI